MITHTLWEIMMLDMYDDRGLATIVAYLVVNVIMMGGRGTILKSVGRKLKNKSSRIQIFLLLIYAPLN